MDHYVTGTEGNDTYTGNGGNTLYYRMGEGHDTMDGSGLLYVVKDKSTASATLVRFDRFREEDGTFSVPQDIEEIAASPNGRYVYFRKNTTPDNAVYRIDLETNTTAQSARFRDGGGAITIEKMTVTGDNTVLLAWHTAYDTTAAYPDWLPAEIKLGQFQFGSPLAEHVWTWNPDWETEINFDGDPNIKRLGDSWDYRVAFNLVTGITAYTEHYAKFTYQPTGRNHYSGVTTYVYRNDNTTGEMVQVPAQDFPDWDAPSLEPAYTSNGALIYRSHPDYVTVSGDHCPNFIDAVYTANQETNDVLTGKYVSSWDEGGTTVNLSDMWENPPDAHLSISIQYLADYQGDIVITKHERDADSGETLSLKLIKFTPAAVAGEAVLGTSSDDSLTGTAGNDYFYGDAGDDEYVFHAGDGNDIINDYSPDKNTPGAEEHRLILWPVEPVEWYVSGLELTENDIAIETSGADLIFNIIPTGESIRVMNWCVGRAFQLDMFSYDYNGYWDRETINSFLPILQGTEDYDTLLAGPSVKFINGEGANDYISVDGGGHIITGGPGEDNIVFETNASDNPNTLIWNPGDDFDGVMGDYDQLILAFGAGISPGDITFEESEYGWIINTQDSGGMLFIQNGYGTGELSKITFADGMVWNTSDIEAMRGGEMSPFSMSMREVASAFWDSLERENSQPEQPINESSSQSGGGCDTGIAGILALAVFAVITKSNSLKR